MENRNHTNLTYEERLKIEVLYQAHKTVAEIAVYLRRGERTIYREIKRGLYLRKDGSTWKDYKSYSADIAQIESVHRSQNRARPIKIGHNYDLANFIAEQMDGKTSPSAIAKRILDEKEKFKITLSAQTIYRYIHNNYLCIDKRQLPQGAKKRKYTHVKHYHLKNPLCKCITDRAPEIAFREDLGHWEQDTVVGKAKGKNAVLLVLSERKTRYEIVLKIPSKSARSVCDALNKLRRKCGRNFKDIFKTITVDNGTEFSDTKNMEKYCPIYYCHPYSSWERGTNENINKMIRRHIPKGKDITPYTHKDIRYIQNWINNYPRKILGWQTAKEAFQAELTKLGITNCALC